MSGPSDKSTLDEPLPPLRTTEPVRDEDDLMAELARSPARQVQCSAGSTIGRFVLLHRRGGGGFGIVYAARDPELGRRVAIKVMRARGETHPRLTQAQESEFKREAETAARLNHPNIVTLHDSGTKIGRAHV